MTKWALGRIISCIVILLTCGLLFPNPVCFAVEREGISPEGNGSEKISGKDVEISVFATREEAEKLAEKVSGSGFEAVVRQHKTDDGRTVFGVFVIIHSESPQGTQMAPSAGTVEAESPVGTRRTPSDIFSRSASYFHGGLTVSEIYTDNAFNTNTDKKTNLSTVLTPLVWISVPRINQKPAGLDLIDPRASGGLSLSREKVEADRRYQAYLIYQSDIPVHSRNSPSGNMVTHNAQGGIAYNSPSGFSIEVNDEFSRYYETADTSVQLPPGEVDKYNSNLFYALLSYDTGSRFRFRFDYSHFFVTYDAERNAARDRADDSFSAYVYYKLRPKTSLFFQYAFIDTSYSSDTTLNSRGHNFFLGVEWKITAKSKGSVKAGYGLRDFVDSSMNNRTFVFEGKVEHRFTPKTSLTVTASRRTDETNIPSTFFVLSDEVELRYQQMLTSKITGSLAFDYAHQEYGEDLTLGGLTAKRKDDIYRVSLGLQYEFRKWLKAGITYLYAVRNSNFPDFNYSNNTVLATLTGSL